MIANLVQKVKSFCENNQSDLYIALVIFFVGIIGFGLGRLSVVWPEKEPITIESPKATNSSKAGWDDMAQKKPEQAAVVGIIQGKYVASKSGSAYHFPWCQGAQKIKEANKIWFNSKEEAKAKGYKPAGNCEGL